MEIHFFFVPDKQCFRVSPSWAHTLFQAGSSSFSGMVVEPGDISCQRNMKPRGRRLRSAAATCGGEGCASFSQDFSGLVLMNELEEAGELCTLTQILMPDVKERF